MSDIITLAQSIAEELVDHNAEMLIAPEFDLPSLATQRVVVAPIAQEVRILSRASREIIFRIDIAVLYRAKNIDIDAMLELVQSIGESFLGKKISRATCYSIEYNPIYDAEMLRTKNQFCGVVNLAFKVVK